MLFVRSVPPSRSVPSARSRKGSVPVCAVPIKPLNEVGNYFNDPLDYAGVFHSLRVIRERFPIAGQNLARQVGHDSLCCLLLVL